MPRTVITVARQIGSEGDRVAAELAQALGVQLIERQLLEAAANAAGVSPETIQQAEKVPNLLERMLEYLGSQGSGLDPLVDLPTEGTAAAGAFNVAMTTDAYRQLLERVIRQTAQETDAVIVAHGGSIVLRDLPYVFRVLVCAPSRVRIQRVQDMMHSSLEEAERQVREDDKLRAEYFQTYYKVNWTNPALYDLTLNTARLSTPGAVEVIRRAHSQAMLSDM